MLPQSHNRGVVLCDIWTRNETYEGPSIKDVQGKGGGGQPKNGPTRTSSVRPKWTDLLASQVHFEFCLQFQGFYGPSKLKNSS